jgi:hypothetical protein
MVDQRVVSVDGNPQVPFAAAQLCVGLKLAMKITAAGNQQLVPVSQVQVVFLMGC